MSDSAGLISICIPSYCRPKTLELAVRSVLCQRYSELEILIGDDSPDNESEDLVARLVETSSVSIRYFHNKPSKGQNANVNDLIKAATGERLIVLHDDDTLLPEALELLTAAWQDGVHIAFGRQRVIDDFGNFLPERDAAINGDYLRTSEYAGRHQHPLTAAFLQQIPNDGFLVTSSYAKQTGYRSNEEVGVFCDLDFNVRLAEILPLQSVVIIDAYISEYRISIDAITSSARSRDYEHPRAALAAYEYALAMRIDPAIESARVVLLERLAANALKGYANRGLTKKALETYLSKYMPAHLRHGVKGIYHLLYVFNPKLARLLRKFS